MSFFLSASSWIFPLRRGSSSSLLILPGLLRSDRGGLSVSSPLGEREDACGLRRWRKFPALEYYSASFLHWISSLSYPYFTTLYILNKRFIKQLFPDFRRCRPRFEFPGSTGAGPRHSFTFISVASVLLKFNSTGSSFFCGILPWKGALLDLLQGFRGTRLPQPHFGVSELVLSLACCTFCCCLLPFVGVLSLSVSPFSLISPTQTPVIDTQQYSCWYFADVFSLFICVLEFVIYFVVNIDHIWSYIKFSLYLLCGYSTRPTPATIFPIQIFFRQIIRNWIYWEITGESRAPIFWCSAFFKV